MKNIILFISLILSIPGCISSPTSGGGIHDVNVFEDNIQFNGNLTNKTVCFVGCQVLKPLTWLKADPDFLIGEFNEGLDNTLRPLIEYNGVIENNNLESQKKYYVSNGSNVIYGTSNASLVFDIELLCFRKMENSCIKYLNQVLSRDIYLIANFELYRNYKNTQVEYKMIICIYDRNGKKIFSKKYKQIFSNIELNENTYTDLLVSGLPVLMKSNYRELNDDLSFIKLAKLPQGKTLEDLYLEYNKQMKN